jgi:hypothetical protein
MTASTFLFATGIENSYPTINGGRPRIDEMEKCGHRARKSMKWICERTPSEPLMSS